MTMEPQAVIGQLKTGLSPWQPIKIALTYGLSPTIGGLATNLPAVLGRFHDDTYQYTHTASFNPYVARELEAQAREAIRDPTLDRIKKLVADLEDRINGYADETGNPGLKIAQARRLSDMRRMVHPGYQEPQP